GEPVQGARCGSRTRRRTRTEARFMIIADLNEPQWWTKLPFARNGSGKFVFADDPTQDPVALKCHGRRKLLAELTDAPKEVLFQRKSGQGPVAFYFDFWEARNRKSVVVIGKSLPGAGFAAWYSARKEGQDLVIMTTMPDKHRLGSPFAKCSSMSMTAK